MKFQRIIKMLTGCFKNNHKEACIQIFYIEIIKHLYSKKEKNQQDFHELDNGKEFWA